MKKIKFEKSGDNKILIIIYVSAFMILICDMFDLSFFGDAKSRKLTIAIAILTITIVNLRFFLYRNFVQWNKKGISIKLDTIFYKNYPFEHIEQINFPENSVEIINIGGKRHAYNLQDYDVESKSKLKDILKSNIEIQKENRVAIKS